MNEDMKKFREMTKPMKFRTLKMIKQSIGLTYEVGKERIKYLINYLLYKLKYLKRNTYRDIVEEHQSLPHQYTPVVLTTDDFKATVLMTLRIEKSINQDYFYREDKDGNRKITYFLKKEEIVRLFSEARLTDIHLCISGVLYDVNHLPTFKAVVLTENFEGFEP